MAGKIKEGDNVLLVAKDGKSFIKTVELRTFHSQYGALELKKLIGKPYGSVMKTSSEKEFLALEPDFRDKTVISLKRGPQIIHRKDIGFIISSCGITGESKVLEAGTGSAYLTSHLASIAKEIITYEARESHYKIAKKNIETMGFKNVKLKLGEVEKAKEKGFDVVILDLPAPDEAIPSIIRCIKNGGRLCVYSPSIEQMVRSKKVLEENGFMMISMKEIILRGWDTGKCIRPSTQMLGHTGFLMFARYVKF